MACLAVDESCENYALNVASKNKLNRVTRHMRRRFRGDRAAQRCTSIGLAVIDHAHPSC